MRCIPWKKRSARDCKLYLILDTQVASYTALYDVACRAVDAGVDIVQLRDKVGSAREMIAFSRRVMPVISSRAVYIINDRADVACAVGADGVHVGQDDLPVACARAIVGRRAIVGVSCQTLAHARQAVVDGADYIGLGSLFKTLTKPERQPMDVARVREVVGAIRIPVFAIGGITAARIDELRISGINRVAVCRAICAAADVTGETRALKRALEQPRDG